MFCVVVCVVVVCVVCASLCVCERESGLSLREVIPLERGYSLYRSAIRVKNVLLYVSYYIYTYIYMYHMYHIKCVIICIIFDVACL